MLKLALSLILLLFSAQSVDAAQYYFLRYREHATDCKSLTDGGYYDICRQLSDNNWYSCRPDTGGVNGTCSTSGEWKLIVSDSGINLWQATATGDMRTSDLNSNVGIGTDSPMHRVEVKGTVEADELQVNGDPACRLSGANCPAPIFFNPNSYGPVDAWGNGTAYDWVFNAGAITPILSFSSGLVELKQAGFKVYGTTSGMKMGNNMFIHGVNPRELEIGSTGGTYNHNLIINNDIKSTKILFTSDSATALDFDLLGVQNTVTNNNFGAVSVGTAGTGSSVATVTGNVSIGTSYFNKVVPTNGMGVQGNVGIGTYTPSDVLEVKGGSIRAGGYKSSDGSAGVTVTTCTSFKNGICVSGT